MLSPEESRRAARALASPYFSAPPLDDDAMRSQAAYAAWEERRDGLRGENDRLSQAIKDIDRRGGTLADMPPSLALILAKAEAAIRNG